MLLQKSICTGYVVFNFPNKHWTEKKAIDVLTAVQKTMHHGLFSISHSLKVFFLFGFFGGVLVCWLVWGFFPLIFFFSLLFRFCVWWWWGVCVCVCVCVNYYLKIYIFFLFEKVTRYSFFNSSDLVYSSAHPWLVPNHTFCFLHYFKENSHGCKAWLETSLSQY